jgi:AraC-like DNA-binding protein
MWIDGGHAHRGKGATGSDFVTLFVPAWTAKTASTRAGLTTLSRRAAEIVVRVAASVLRGQPDHAAITALQGLRSELCPHPQTHAVEPGTVRRAKAELDFRFSEGVDLTALSKVAGTSPWHLSRSFSERLGVPPMQYRKQLRLLAATWAMVQGASVTGAAAQAGFTDGPHFSRTFRAQYGISPAQWRASVAPALKGNQAAFD